MISPYTVFDIEQARERADRKHGVNGIEQLPVGSDRWLAILTEELGEVAHTLTYDVDDEWGDALVSELIDVASVATAWLDALLGRRRHARAIRTDVLAGTLPPVRRDDVAPTDEVPTRRLRNTAGDPGFS